MDTSRQLYENEATGPERGVYEDVTATFRAPVVNWIWRTLMANEPGFARYLWGQVKPLFETEAFGRFSMAYRDAVLSAVGGEVPTYRREEAGVAPAEFRELRGQLATFDVVAPRLSVLFETVDRAIHGRPVGDSAVLDRASTAPMPGWIDSDRGRTPTMIAFDDVPDDLEVLVRSIQEYHGFEEGLPSVYRCLLQWPGFAERAWADLEPVLRGDGFADACDAAGDLTAGYVDDAPYVPRLAPEDLRRLGLDDGTIEDLQGLFREFNAGAVETVLPALPVYAATVGAAGPRG